MSSGSGISPASPDPRPQDPPRMHVLCLIQFFAPDGCEGSGRLHDVIRRLTRSGHSVTVITGQISYLTGLPFRDYEGRTVVRESDPAGCEVLRIRTLRGYHASFTRRALALLVLMAGAAIQAAIHRRPDVVLASSPPPTLGLIGALLSLVRGVPFVYEIRDLWIDDAATLGLVSRGIVFRLLRAVERWTERQAAALIPVTPGLAERLIERGVSEEQTITIPNGVDLNRFRANVEHRALATSLQLEGRFVVVCAGALGYNNDLPVLLEAAERLREHQEILILVVGDGGARPSAEREAHRRGLENIRFTGWVTKSAVPQYLCAADAAICIALDNPANHIAYANRAFDAMACELPLICMIDGDLRELVESAGCGCFVQPGSDEALASAILRLRAMPVSERRAMGRRGRELVEAAFDRELTASRLAACVEVVGDSGTEIADLTAAIADRI